MATMEQLMQAWADYLDQLRVGKGVEPGTLGLGIAGIPGIPNANSTLDISR